MSDAIEQCVVVCRRHAQKFDTALLQLRHGADDVVGGERKMLHAGAAIEIQILIDLALFLAGGRLIDRELDAIVAARDHLRHQ